MTRAARIDAAAPVDANLQRAMDDWQATVMGLSRLDATTTEVVRLRCARYHDCLT